MLLAGIIHQYAIQCDPLLLKHILSFTSLIWKLRILLLNSR